MAAGVMLLVASVSAPAVAQPVPPGAFARWPSVERWQPLIAAAAARFGVPVDWIARVMHAESAGRTSLGSAPVTSPKGAMGLMQLMPGTWADMRFAHGLGHDPYDPADNILAGTAYLRLLYDRFGYPGLFGAYNAGPERYGAWIEKGRPLPSETRSYLAALAPNGHDPATPPPSRPSPAPRLFAIDRRAPTALAGDAAAVAPGLFAVLAERPAVRLSED